MREAQHIDAGGAAGSRLTFFDRDRVPAGAEIVDQRGQTACLDVAIAVKVPFAIVILVIAELARGPTVDRQKERVGVVAR